MANIEAKSDGEFLRLTVHRENDSKGVELKLPAEGGTLEAAVSVLMTNLAGVSEVELHMAAFKALDKVA